MAIETASFSTRARVVDLLGREQIADAPTAVSELLKNAVDAQSPSVSVHYRSDIGTLTISDTGLGMRKQEDLLDRWLILATESKRGAVDRSWMRFATREQQQKALTLPPLGEKGIGRLAMAALGRGVLVWTRWGKGKSCQRTLLLVHWDMFRHPRLTLGDIHFPCISLEPDEDPADQIPALCKALASSAQKTADQWEGEEEFDLLARIAEDAGKKFPDSIGAAKDLPAGMGTSFVILGTTDEVDDLFRKEEQEGDDLDVSEGLKLLLGFSDPFGEAEKARIELDIKVNGATPQAGQNFWVPDDFPQADHEISITMDENGFVTGKIRRFAEIEDYQYQVREMPPRTRFPGPVKLHIGYLEGDADNSIMAPDLHSYYQKRATAFGSLYVYRDGIRVLPYGRTDQDFLGFEERRSRNAGRYFFSHRRMFGGLYVNTSGNPDLRDKAGREGFIKNGAYRGLVKSLTEVFKDLADLHYGSRSDREDKRKQTGAEKKRAHTARARARNAKRRFLRDVSSSKRILSRLRSEWEALAKELETVLVELAVAPENETVHERVADCIGRFRSSLGMGVTALVHEVPPIVRLSRGDAAAFDAYLSEREMAEKNAREKIAEGRATVHRLTTGSSASDDTVAEVAHTITEIRDSVMQTVVERRAAFVEATRELTEERSAVWVQEQKELLDSTMRRRLGDVTPDQIAADGTGELVAKMEVGRFDQAQVAQEVILPVWDRLLGELQSLSELDATDQQLGEMNREMERLEERERTFGELAQLGLIVESLDHEYNVLFGSVFDAIVKAKKTDIGEEGAAAIEILSDAFESLRAKLELLSPLYRRRLGYRATVTGKEIGGFLRRLFAEDFSGDTKLTWTRGFADNRFSGVNRPVLLASVANLVKNALFWVSKVAGDKEIRLTLTPGGLVVSDNGPGIASRDRDRVFDPFFSRRPGGRGLGLYIAKSNLASSGILIYVADAPHSGALPGANFVIVKDQANQE